MSKFDNMYSLAPETNAKKMLTAVRTALAGINREGLRMASGLAFARESLSAANADSLDTTWKGLGAGLQQALNAAGLTKLVTANQLHAACESGILAASPRDFLQREIATESNEPNFVGMGGLTGAFAKRWNLATEAYNEQDNAKVLENTVTYNLLAGRQNPAGELFFPTTTVPGDNSGVAVTLRVFQAVEDVKHANNGSVTDFKRRNLIDGLIDGTILRNDGTLTIPVSSAENAAMFATGVTPVAKTFEGRTITTAPLAFGKEINIMSMSADATLLAAGVMDFSDTLDQDIKLVKVYLKVGTDIIPFRTDILASNNFIYVGQNNYRKQTLSLRTKTLYLDKNAKTFAGAALAAAGITAIATDHLIVRLSGNFTGEVDLNTSTMIVEAASAVKVEAIFDEDTNADVTATTGAAVKTALEAGTWVGYDQESRRANLNHRERGQIIDTQYYTQRWAVPLRSPVVALRPPSGTAAQDGDDLEKAATTTYIRTSAAAIQTVISTVDQLRAVKGMNLEPSVQPESFGVARFLLNSILVEDSVNAALNVGSLNSASLEDDVSAMLLNRIRDVVYRMYRDSKFQAVVESGAAGTTEQPTVMVITDPMTARYLFVKGEIRAAGPDFKMVVKPSPNKDVEGKIFIAFGYPNEAGSSSINALHFGAMLWSAELAMVLPISRNGQTSKELTVQPRFRHIVNVGVLGYLTVENLSQVVKGRVPVDFHTV